MFARAMFAKPAKYQITINEIESSVPADIAAAISEGTASSIESQDEAIVHILAHAPSPEDFVSIARNLGALTDWRLEEEHQVIEGRDVVLFMLTALVGEDAGMPSMSEVVCFAPFDFLPTTRRAPCCAWSIRTKPANSLESKDQREERRANLAAIPIKLPAQSFNNMWVKSQQLRAELDGADNITARARVTLMLPAEFCGH